LRSTEVLVGEDKDQRLKSGRGRKRRGRGVGERAEQIVVSQTTSTESKTKRVCGLLVFGVAPPTTVSLQ
jgi:hypothetical protein